MKINSMLFKFTKIHNKKIKYPLRKNIKIRLKIFNASDRMVLRNFLLRFIWKRKIKIILFRKYINSSEIV